MKPGDRLRIWTIYRNPDDFPGFIVVRRWLNDEPDGCAALFRGIGEDQLARARAYVQQEGGDVPIARAPSDAPCIVESWL